MRPHHADLLVRNASGGAGVAAEPPRLRDLAGLDVPQLDGLVSARRDEALRIGSPANGKDTPGVLALANGAGRLARLAIVQLDALVGADGDEGVPVGGEGGAEDEAPVQAGGLGVELEGGAVQEAHGHVVADGGGAERARGAHGDGVDDLGVARDLADAVAAIGRQAVAEALAAVAHGDDALRLPVPRYVVDAARDDVVLPCTSKHIYIDDVRSLYILLNIDIYPCLLPF